MAFGSFNRVRIWLISPSTGASAALLVILTLFISNVEASKPATFFGRYSDDALYFSCAQALAQHHQYVLPSFPGIPLKPQVPILYPLLLSEVWKVWRNFPENLAWAIRLTEGFGCLALLCSFFLLRRVAGLARVPSLMLTAVCAFHPFLLRLSGLTMTDVPFATMFLLAVLLAHWTLSSGISLGPTAALGVVTALSASLRSLGYMVVLGVLTYIFYRREYRRALVYSFAVAITIASFFFLTAHYAPLAQAANIVPTHGANLQWERLIVFHTEYVRFHWRMGIPTLGAFLSMLKENCLQLVSWPGPFLAGSFDRRTWLLTAGMSAIVLSGTVRLLRRPEWRVLAFMTVPYLLVVLLWPYPLMERFLLPLLPIFLLATVLEAKRLFSLALSKLAPPSSRTDRVLAICLCAVLLAYGVFSGWAYLFQDPQQLREAADAQAKTLAQKQEAYSWIRDHTAADAKIVAYDDILLFLYSQRQALRPIAILPAAAYSKTARDSPSLTQDLAHLSDAPREAGASYWLVTDDDFSLEAERTAIAARENEIASVLPMVFRSSKGFARLYDSSCLLSPSRDDCKTALPVLFPGTP